MVAFTTSPAVLAPTGDGRSIERVTAHFYEGVVAHPVLAPVLATLPGDARRHVAQFVAEVFGGRDGQRDDVVHAHLMVRHLGKHLSLQERRSWMDLLLESADAAGVPDDPEFRAALVAYLEWGFRIAARRSPKESRRDEEHHDQRRAGRAPSALQC